MATTLKWIAGNRYLSMSEMQNNAQIIWDYLGTKGWSLNAVCGMLGNMQSESSINPQIWESLKPNEKRGYGLTQWTPATKLIKWSGKNYMWGNVQLDRIIWEKDNNQQWFKNPEAPIVNPPITFKQFSTSVLEVETLADYFLWYYEHPAVTIQPKRAEQARYWLEFFGGGGEEPPRPPDPPPPNPQPKGEFTSWEFLKYVGRII